MHIHLGIWSISYYFVHKIIGRYIKSVVKCSQNCFRIGFSARKKALENGLRRVGRCYFCVVKKRMNFRAIKNPEFAFISGFLASPARLERATSRLGGGPSIQVRYGDIIFSFLPHNSTG